jgi:hypothetical protein
MPACKNDAARTYVGTELSPKGLGYCAHAAALGSTHKGKDGRSWTVRADKNGVKAWKPVTAKARAELSFNMSLKFSDGTGLSYSIGHPPSLHSRVSGDAPLTRAHRDALVSAKRPITLRLDRGETALSAVDVAIPAPVTAGKVVEAMRKFYATKLTEDDYQALATDLPNWNPLHVGTTMASFKKAVKKAAQRSVRVPSRADLGAGLRAGMVFVTA